MQTSTFSNEICAFHAVWFLFLNSFKIVCGIVLDTLVKKKKKKFSSVCLIIYKTVTNNHTDFKSQQCKT